MKCSHQELLDHVKSYLVPATPSAPGCGTRAEPSLFARATAKQEFDKVSIALMWSLVEALELEDIEQARSNGFTPEAKEAARKLRERIREDYNFD